MTTAATVRQNGGDIPRSRREMANWPQQRLAPVLSPRLRHNGGCSRVSRRTLWRKSRQSVTVPVPAAVYFGDNFAHTANQKEQIFLLSLR